MVNPNTSACLLLPFTLRQTILCVPSLLSALHLSGPAFFTNVSKLPNSDESQTATRINRDCPPHTINRVPLIPHQIGSTDIPTYINIETLFVIRGHIYINPLTGHMHIPPPITSSAPVGANVPLLGAASASGNPGLRAPRSRRAPRWSSRPAGVAGTCSSSTRR